MSIVGTAWLRTDDKYCHKPTFDIRCKYCGGDMVLRFSEIDIKDVKERGCYINYVAYKCPYCAWIARFEVEDTLDYLLGIAKIRNGIAFFVPDSSEWVGEDEKKRQQLEALGYVGGR